MFENMDINPEKKLFEDIQLRGERMSKDLLYHGFSLADYH